MATPSKGELEKTVITGIITSAIGVFLGIVINNAYQNYKDKRGGFSGGFVPPGMGM